MATNFPNSPSNGATHTFGGTTYTYNSTKSVWKASAEAIAVGDNPPSNPEAGDLWFDSSVAKTYIYYNDGSSSQWVQLNPSGGSDGADATGDGESPIIYTEPPTTTQSLNYDGTTSTVQMQAVDPEGTAITYGIAYANSTNARPAQLSADTTIDQTTGTYTFTPSTTSSDAGTFKARLSASDGVQTSTRFVNFSLAFIATVDYLVVGGGGGGGLRHGGGGGAGGYIYSTGQTLTAGTTYNITVGTGGAGASGATSTPGSNGTDSSISGTGFTTVTAIGGGGGGTSSAAGSGGSGGGGGYTATAGGSGTVGQGNDGGAGQSGSPYHGGGGGGAGAAGSNAGSIGGDGGAGLQNSITGTALYYAGGGGGGTYNTTGTSAGGSGVGGSGSSQQNTSGTPVANTGSGGGGNGGSGGSATYNGTATAGADGVVIIRTTSTASATTGSPTLTQDGSYNVYKFTADGSITF